MADVVQGKVPAASRGGNVSIAREILTIPNVLTGYRFVVGVLIWAYTIDPAWLLFFAVSGSLTDFFDGLFARVLKQETRFGRTFDQISDFVFGLALGYAIYKIEGGLHWYSAPIAGAVGAYTFAMIILWISGKIIGSSWISKVRMAVQFIAAIVIIAVEASYPAKDSVVVLTLAYGALWYSIYMMAQTLADYSLRSGGK